MNVQNTTAEVVGRGDQFVVSDDEDVAPYLELLGGEVGSTKSRQAKEREQGADASAGDAPTAGGDAMQTDD